MGDNKIAIQDTYGERFRYCWGCGSLNENGLHIKTYPSESKDTCISKFVPESEFTGGVPNNLFGGMIAIIFDCHGTASAAYFNLKNKGLDLKEDTIIERFITARLEIDYKKPTPMGIEIKVISKLGSIEDKKAIINMELVALGEVRAKAKMVAVKVKDDM